MLPCRPREPPDKTTPSAPHSIFRESVFVFPLSELTKRMFSEWHLGQNSIFSGNDSGSGAPLESFIDHFI